VILVIGGRSKISLALIESLRARGKRVRALVRAQEADAAFPVSMVDTRDVAAVATGSRSHSSVGSMVASTVIPCVKEQLGCGRVF
jgi:uncharacterized protein YbjT (DUF2867 family)